MIMKIHVSGYFMLVDLPVVVPALSFGLGEIEGVLGIGQENYWGEETKWVV